MYLRQSKQKRADGREITYLQLAENVWDATKGRSQAQIVFNCGRADDPGWRLVCAWPYDDVHALQAVWQQLWIDAIVRAQAHGWRFGFEMERALCFQVADLLSLDVEIVFYDTTSLHFEIDDEDKGDEAGQMRGSDTAGAKLYVAPRKRGYGKNGRGDAPQAAFGQSCGDPSPQLATHHVPVDEDDGPAVLRSEFLEMDGSGVNLDDRHGSLLARY